MLYYFQKEFELYDFRIDIKYPKPKTSDEISKLAAKLDNVRISKKRRYKPCGIKKNILESMDVDRDEDCKDS